MIAFDSVSRDEMEAMITPMHRVLSPAPIPPSSSASAPTATALAKSAADANIITPSASATTGALYLGSMAAAHDTDLLHAHHITHLVQVLEVPWMPQTDVPGFQYYRIDIEDNKSATLQPYLEEACDYIRAALGDGNNVLVHCQQGVSRSASIVIAYLIQERSMGYDDAYQLVRQRRKCIKPNPGFVETLREWETSCTLKTKPPMRRTLSH
ncbi:phosphatases II [Favolaschia claudopus]|uniref:protein-tyrosine-phosphatase n=1 Tax=Favolaschia claudopus TaxID=2862362 RepID=A0AAW0BG31_9AGAR